MPRKSLTNSGFGALEGLLILIIIGLVGFTGYYVYHAQQKTSNTYSTATQETAATPAATRTYTNKELGFAFSYPAAWGTVQLGSQNTASVNENDQDSYWAIQGFSKDTGSSLRLSGASAHYSNSHGIDDITYTSGFDETAFKAVQPKCPAAYAEDSASSCQVLANHALLVYNDKIDSGFSVTDRFAVLNLQPNKDNIAAVRLEYLGYKELGTYPDANISVTAQSFQKVAESFRLLKAN